MCRGVPKSASAFRNNSENFLKSFLQFPREPNFAKQSNRAQAFYEMKKSHSRVEVPDTIRA